jgi:hypothetical protein
VVVKKVEEGAGMMPPRIARWEVFRAMVVSRRMDGRG